MSSSAGIFINELIGNIELMNMAGPYLNNLKKCIQCRISYGSIFGDSR